MKCAATRLRFQSPSGFSYHYLPTAQPANIVSDSLNFSDRSKPSFIEVGPEHEGQRVDNYLLGRFKGLPKSRVYQMIRKGELRVNKSRAKPTTRLCSGDLLRLPPLQWSETSKPQVSASLSDVLKASVLFEDDALLVLNKPSGLAVHAGSGVAVGLIEAMRDIRPDLKYLELAHRLDRETSGCLVLAKRGSVLRRLHEAFRRDDARSSMLDKRYLCLVLGRWRHGARRVEKPLLTDARRRGERHVVVSSDGVYAASLMRPVDVSDAASLIEVTILTGRTHQVRVHTQSEGHPIAGDTRYGDDAFNQRMRQAGLKRLFLQASRLTFTHPISNQTVSFDAPLPDELRAVLSQLNLTTTR